MKNCASSTRVLAVPRGAWLLGLALALPLSSPLSAQQVDTAPPQGDSTALAPGVWALDGRDPALPYDDLEPLRRIVGNARFVGLGEAIHTSGGFYTMKHRLFRFLVEEMGFRVLGIESPWFPVDLFAARYVQDCIGTPQAATRGLFGVWRSEELAEALLWMCQWNQAHPDDPVSFYGFDIQWMAYLNVPAVTSFLVDRLGFAADHPWIVGMQACDDVVDNFYPFERLPADRYETCSAAVGDLRKYLEDNRRSIVRKTSKEEYEMTLVHLVSNQAWQEQAYLSFDEDFTPSFNARDKGMAYVAQALAGLRFPGQRVALWGHNFHILKAGDKDPDVNLVTLGTNLANELGRRYRAIGLATRFAAIDWLGVGCGPWIDYGDPVFFPNSAELALYDLGAPFAVADLRRPPGRPSFFEPGVEYSLNGPPIQPALHFDGLVFQAESPKMRPLAWAPRCE